MRFSIAGLLLFTLGVAGGLAAALAVNSVDMQLFGVDTTAVTVVDRIVAGMQCAVILWIIVGLLYQAWDIRNHLRANPDLTTGHKSSLQFSFLWRVGIVLVLIGSYFLQSVGKRWRTFDEEMSVMGIFLAPAHWSELRWFLMLIAIGARRKQRAKPQNVPPLRRIIHVAAGITAGLLAMIVILEATLIPALVRIAINGVEASHRLSWKRAPIGLELMHTEMLFFAVAQVQAACAVLALLAAARWASVLHSHPSRTRSIIAITSLLLAIAAIACEFWIRLVCWPQISPSMVEGLPWTPQLVNVLFAAITVLYLAGRASYSPDAAHPATWRIHPYAYLHERRITLVVAFLLALTAIGRGLAESITYGRFWKGFAGSTAWDSVFGVLIMPANYWPLAMAILAVMQFREAGDAAVEVPMTNDFSWPRFVTASALFIVVAISLIYTATTWGIASWIPMGW